MLLLDRDAHAVREATSELSGATAYELDVSDAQAVAVTFVRIVERHGRVDALVNNAGVLGEQRPIHLTSDETWASVMRVNCRRRARATWCAALGSKPVVYGTPTGAVLPNRPRRVWRPLVWAVCGPTLPIRVVRRSSVGRGPAKGVTFEDRSVEL